MSIGGVNNLELVLGARVQSLRRAAGLTQQQLCNKANISYSTLTKIERGAIKSPSVFTVEALANAIGISLDQLIGNGQETVKRQIKTSKHGINFVYFDVNGCLVRFYQRAFNKIAEDYQVPAYRVETAYWHYNDAVCKGTITGSEFNQKMADKIGINKLNWLEYYLEAVEAVPETSQLITWVKQHYQIGLITNIMPGALSALRRSGKVPNISYDVIIDSSEVGYLKPDPKMYKLAEQHAKVKPSEILLVDDTASAVAAAEKAGWQVVWFDYANPDESVKRVYDLLELN